MMKNIITNIFAKLALVAGLTLASTLSWGQTVDVLTLDCATPAPTGTTSTALSSTSDVATFLNSAAGLSSAANKITSSAKTGDVYKGKGSGGGDIPQQCLKIGKASGGGGFTFTIPSTYDAIDVVELTCYGWKTTSSISINSGTAQTFTTAQSETTKTFELASSSRTISISVKTSAVCVTEIVLKKKSGGSSAAATTTTISAAGITNTDVYEGIAAGSLSASVTTGGNPIDGASVTWSGNNDAVATINASSGAVTLVAAGKVTFTASYAGVSGTYQSSSDTYEMTVTDSTPFSGGDVEFDATKDTGTSPLSKNGVSLACSNGVLNNGSEYRLYKSSTTTFSVTSGVITSIAFTGVSGNPASGFASQDGWTTSGNNGTWTGSSTSVSFTASGAQVRATKIVVTVSLNSSKSNSDLTITNESTALAFDLYNNSSAQVINYTTSSTGEITITPSTPTDYFSYVHDATAKTITVTPIAVTPSKQTITISQAADETYAAGTKTFTVSVANSAPIANIAALVTGGVNGRVQLTDALVTYKNGTTAYLEDASGAIMLYQCAGDLVAGDKITGIMNVTNYSVYNNLPEIKAFELENGYTKTSGNIVTPTEVTIATLEANYTNYISRYVKIVGATVTSAFSSKNSTIEQSGSSIVLRDQNSSATLTSTVGDIVTVTAHPSIYSSTHQIAVYEQSQIVVAKVDPTLTFNNGTVRVGSTLDLTTLFSSNSTGTVTYSITSGDSYATLSGSTLTGTAEGSVTVKAEQAESASYNAGEATATITVNPALELSSIAITTSPTKTTYDEGEVFDPTGMVVTATYTDNSTFTVTGYTYSPNGALTTSDTEITISYTESGVTKTATQAITVNEVIDYAILPFNWEGGSSSDLQDQAGVTTSTLSSDYAASTQGIYLIKFDNTGKYIQVKTDSRPGTVTVGVKMIGGNSTSTLIVQGSANGDDFTDVEELTISGKQNDILNLETSNIFAETDRYVRLYFNKGSNVGIGPISIAKYVEPSSDPVISAENVDIDCNAFEGSITFTINNPVDGGVVTASKEADWITLGAVSENAVAFTCTANTGDERSATVTLTYTYNTNQTVTKDVTVTQAAYVAPPVPTNWELTTLAELTEDDVFIIVGDNGSGLYALANDNGTSNAPSAVEMNGSVPNNVKWNISGNSTDGYVFYPNGTTDKWLYCTNTNNGVRVGTNDNNKLFSLVDGYLFNSATSRYVGVYSSQDWRCYTTNSGNIADQTFTFYKKVVPDGVASSITLTCSANGGRYWATFYNGKAQYVIPDDTPAKAFTMNGDHELYLLGSNGHIIPEDSAVIIISDVPQVTLIQNNKGSASVSDTNILVGSDTAVENNGKQYVLGIKDGVLKFYLLGSIEVPAGKAYYVNE